MQTPTRSPRPAGLAPGDPRLPVPRRDPRRAPRALSPPPPSTACTVVYWDDVLLRPHVKMGPVALPASSTHVLQTWNNGPANMKHLAVAGYRVVVSLSDFYYLDCGHDEWVSNDSRYDQQEQDPPGHEPFNYGGRDRGSWCTPFKGWQRVYDYDITHTVVGGSVTGTGDVCRRVLDPAKVFGLGGGAGCQPTQTPPPGYPIRCLPLPSSPTPSSTQAPMRSPRPVGPTTWRSAVGPTTSSSRAS